MGSGLSVIQFQLTAKRQKNSRLRAALMCLTLYLVDAACMPLHCIYSQSYIRDLLQLEVALSGEPLENIVDFFVRPSSPLYSYPLGSLSPYGYELLPVFESLVMNNGLDVESLQDAVFTFLKGYNGKVNAGTASFMSSRSNGEPWNMCVPIDHQCSGLLRIPFLVARYLGSDPELYFSKTNDIVNSIQRSGLADSCASLLAVLMGCILMTSLSTREALQFLGRMAVNRLSKDNDESELRSYFYSKCVPLLYSSVQKADVAFEYIRSLMDLLPGSSGDILCFIASDESIYLWTNLAKALRANQPQSTAEDDASYNFRLLANFMNGAVTRASSANNSMSALRTRLSEAITDTPGSVSATTRARNAVEGLLSANGEKLVDAIPINWCVVRENQSLSSVPPELLNVVSSFGLSGLLPGFLLSTLFLCIKCDAGGCGNRNHLQFTTQVNILCGGDSCARGILIGALLGAQLDATVPDIWWSKIDGQVIADCSEMSMQLTAANTFLTESDNRS